MNTTTIPSRSHRPQVIARVAAAILGGYAFAWGVVAAGASLMVAAGMCFLMLRWLNKIMAEK